MDTFELIEFRESAFEFGKEFTGTHELHLGTFDGEKEAIAAGRAAWAAFRQSGSNDVAWWIVRKPGETLARWIADGASGTEQVLDLTTNRLVSLG
jgi:hypothetical protein